jgi:oligopeptide transport system permease protein
MVDAAPEAREHMAELRSREPVQGESLWQDAWRRLKKNKMAMFGLVVTIVMSLSAIFAEALSPYDPATQQRWTGALPPWSRILSLRNEIRVVVGERPLDLEVPGPCAAVLGDGNPHELRFAVQEETVSRVRVVADGDRIEVLNLSVPGAPLARPDEIVVGEGEFFRDAATGARLDLAALRKGEALPPALSPREGRYVVQLEHVGRDPEGRYHVDVRFDGAGAVSAISRDSDGADLETAFLRPGEVTDVALDGRPLTQLHILGTDQEGRDSLSRLIFGGRISLLVGISATLVSLFIGVLYGAVAGYVGGSTDNVMMRIVDILFGLPYLFVVILMMVAFGRSIWILFMALGALQWLTMARIVRGQVLSLREKEFVDAAITVGTRGTQILTRHLIPNVLGVVVVYMTLTVPAVILQESFLAFLGLTVEWDGLPLESWGALVNYGREALGNNGEFWWLLLWPSIAMSLTLFSLNFLGDGLRDAFDPQQRGRT